MISLNLTSIEDARIRDALRVLQDTSNAQMLQVYSLKISGAVTNQLVNHRLGYVPTDILVTSKLGSGAITFTYEKFTKTSITITTTGACEVRFIMGRFGDAIQLSL